MAVALRVNPEQRFSCSQCGRCCRRWEVLVSAAEKQGFDRRGAAQWFLEQTGSAEGAATDPFEEAPGAPGFYRIRKRTDGACGFLSARNTCRLHEELGATRKPLTCRVFPYSFHPAPGAVIVKASFGCPSVVANEGEPIGTGRGLENITALRAEWFDAHPTANAPRVYVPGRAIDARTIGVLRDSLLRLLERSDAGGRDLRINMLRIARLLEDLARSRVVALPDDGFAEYVALTARFAASSSQPVTPRPPAWLAGWLQHGFLFAVAAMRLKIERRRAPPWRLRLAMLRLLAHFHHAAPGLERVDVRLLRRERLDVNAPGIQPIVHHYLRAAIEALGASERPVLDDFAIAVSYLNAASALAVMNARAAGRPVDGAVFSDALMEAMDLAHADDRGVVSRSVGVLTGGVEALYLFAHA